ncbi:MAG: radical SAM protein [Deltaproteobacteria bacterium]|nr:radical SAM protein [Deltaproteobacteria bacterium]
MSEYVARKTVSHMPRLPLEGSLDLTYRCNNDCRHCWLRIPANGPEKREELSFEEIRSIVDQARKLGTREWAISGGEPMLRPDFADIMGYIIKKSSTYTLNTNGTLITPRIARLLKREGVKMVALYGATRVVHDHITRNPGSFEATLRGMAYLREAGARFIVQLIPMKDNYHQWQEMIDLARSLSPQWRCGAAWLFLSASGSPEKNAEIAAQRLSPSEVVALDPPDVSYEERQKEIDRRIGTHCMGLSKEDERLFAGCIESRCEFHVDPYGGLSFCCFVKDPALRYDLRGGSLREAWEEFIPALADRARGGDEWRRNCGSCEKRTECRWCPVYAYLETGRLSAPLPYLCRVAEETRRYKEEWVSRHRRYFEIAGITIQVESHLPLDEIRFAAPLLAFEAQRPGEDLVTLRHVFGMPQTRPRDLGIPLYRKAPWAVYRRGESLIYANPSPGSRNTRFERLAVFDSDYSHGVIYSPADQEATIRSQGFLNLTLLVTDQILIAQLLARRQGCYMHAAGVVLDRAGLLFVGHSSAGKSTVTRMLQRQAEILCDDRIIVRDWPDGFKIHGTWSHGEVQEVSPGSAPLRGIVFLNKSADNRIEPMHDRHLITQRLLACLIKPLCTREWWEQSLGLVERIVQNVPCYDMRFDRSGEIVPHLRELVTDGIR